MEIFKLQMCRICLVENVPMLVVANNTLQELYEKLTDIPFVTEDGRPMLACSFCFTKLKQCYQLQRKCLEAEKLFTQMLNEDGETTPLINPGLSEIFNPYVITPTVHISIIDKREARNNDIKEVPGDSGAQDVIIEPKEELPSDFESEYKVNLDSYQHLEDTNYYESEDMPPHHSESDGEDDVPLVKFKTEVEEDLEWSKERQRLETMTRAPDAKIPEPCIRITKLKDTTKPKKSKLPNSALIRKIQNRTSISMTKLKKPLAKSKPSVNNTSKATNSRLQNPKDDVTGKMWSDNGIDSDKLKKPRILVVNEKPYKCAVCLTRFVYKTSLSRHMRRLHGVKNSRSFNNEESLVNHNIPVDNDEKPHNCDRCHRIFSSKTSLAKHNRKNACESFYQCDLCQRRLTSKRSLIYHIQGHNGEKPFQCDICGHCFGQKGSLRLHILKHTGEKPYKCDICKSTFNQRFKLKHHLRQHTGEKPFKCEKCHLSFSLKGSLNRHVRIHIDNNPHTCEICQRSFSVSSNFKRHMRTHTGEKPYKCEICERSFNQNDKLKNHMRQHSGEKPFKCHLCEESYCVRSSLNRHVRLHAGEKPHKCKICERHFTYTSDLKRHILTHSEVRPFNCEICQKSYSQSSSLNVHIRKTHETQS